MNYRLIAIDLDGTLLNNENIISKNAKKKIAKLNKLGVKIIIATGRMFVSALPYVKELKLKNPVITYNGALIKNVSNKEIIYHKPVPQSEAKKIIKECNKENLHLNLYQDDTLYVDNNSQESRGYEQSSGVKAHEVGPLLKFIDRSPTKLLIIEENREKHQYYLNYFQEKFSDKLEISESKKNYIEFMSKGVSKGNSLKFLTEKYDIKQKEVIAIGDNWNDLPMLKWAGLGIAMENAPDELKQKVDKIAPARKNEGVGHILSEVFNI